MIHRELGNVLGMARCYNGAARLAAIVDVKDPDELEKNATNIKAALEISLIIGTCNFCTAKDTQPELDSEICSDIFSIKFEDSFGVVLSQYGHV